MVLQPLRPIAPLLTVCLSPHRLEMPGASRAFILRRIIGKVERRQVKKTERAE